MSAALFIAILYHEGSRALLGVGLADKAQVVLEDTEAAHLLRATLWCAIHRSYSNNTRPTRSFLQNKCYGELHGRADSSVARSCRRTPRQHRLPAPWTAPGPRLARPWLLQPTRAPLAMVVVFSLVLFSSNAYMHVYMLAIIIIYACLSSVDFRG
jgi:hypothetical protein